MSTSMSPSSGAWDWSAASIFPRSASVGLRRWKACTSRVWLTPSSSMVVDFAWVTKTFGRATETALTAPLAVDSAFSFSSRSSSTTVRTRVNVARPVLRSIDTRMSISEP